MVPGWHTSLLGHPPPSWGCLLPAGFHTAMMSLLDPCATPCTTGVFNHPGLCRQMGIVQGHVAETKSSPVLSIRVVPQPVLTVLAQEATNSNKMVFLLQIALGNHQRRCRVSCAMKCFSREFHGKVSWPPAGLGLPPVFWPSFLLPPPPAHACCHAAKTRAFVHVKCFDGQVSVPTLHMPLQCCQTTAELQLPLGWDVAAAEIAPRPKRRNSVAVQRLPFLIEIRGYSGGSRK